MTTIRSKQEIEIRLIAIDVEIKAIKEQRYENPLTIEDTEDVSDNYQAHLEYNYALNELRDERDECVKELHLLTVGEAK